MRSIVITIVFILTGCSENSITPNVRQLSFGHPQKVRVLDYDDHLMEPFLSRDGTVLLFNNSNDSSVNTNLHSALKISDSVFQYQGELKGVNTVYLEGVPSLDDSNIFYFVSTRSYDQTYSTIYSGNLLNDSVSNVQLVPGISKNIAGWVNFDCEISKDGSSLYSVDGRIDAHGVPFESDLLIALKNQGSFQRADNTIMRNVNTDALEYAPCLSSNLLELYFTRVEPPLSDSSMPQIFVSTRNSVYESFGTPSKIKAISGFVEAPTISPDNQILYYHKKENDRYVLYMVRKE